MRIFMIGEAANHRDKLQAHLQVSHEIIALPREAAFDCAFDPEIGAEDVVISLKFSRPAEEEVPRFRLLHVPGAGLDGIDLARLPETTLLCNVFEHEIPIAEYVMASLLEWEVRLADLRRSFTAATWSALYRERVPHGEVFGNTLALIGYGRIGRAIAQRARAFGLRVIAVDQYASADEHVSDIFPAQRLPEVLAQADYLVIACPLTEQTQGLIDRRAFARMKNSALLVNISRAQIVDEAALYEALKNKVIGGAFLDVWYRYPVGSDDQVSPSDHPLLELENAWCTPHSSAWTRNLPERRYAFIADNINRLLAGEPLRNQLKR